MPVFKLNSRVVQGQINQKACVYGPQLSLAPNGCMLY